MYRYFAINKKKKSYSSYNKIPHMQSWMQFYFKPKDHEQKVICIIQGRPTNVTERRYLDNNDKLIKTV